MSNRGFGALFIEILASPISAISKIVLTAVAILVLNRGGKEIMDLSSMSIPADCELAVAMVLIPITILLGIGYARRSYTEMLNAKGKTKAEVPYTLNYMLGTVIAIVLGAVTAYFCTGFIPAWLNVTGIGVIGYVLFACLCSAVATYIYIGFVHAGIETTLKEVRLKAQMLAKEVPATVNEVKTAVETIQGGKKDYH